MFHRARAVLAVSKLRFIIDRMKLRNGVLALALLAGLTAPVSAATGITVAPG